MHQPTSNDAAALSQRLGDLLRAQAQAAGGLLPFDRFMDLALYAPGLGYYAAGCAKLGAAGDFTTAPEVSPLFGRCLAAQAREALTAVPGGDILEFGAGTGALAAELLESLQREGPMPGRYLILEPSPDLQARQAETLGRRVPWARVEWLSGLPQGFRGLVLANEVLDAMPVHRFRIGADGSPLEVLVRPPALSQAEGWEEVAAEPVSPGLAEAVLALQARGLATEPGFASEVNLRLGPWMAALAGALDQALVLLIDYGYPQADYYRAERSAGTLMCHARHRTHPDPYRDIGLQDITAHVDFTAVAGQGLAAGLTLGGYTTQALFLIGCGLDRELAAADPAEALDLALGARTLVLPSAMGERFQVLALARGLAGPWCGFSSRDLSPRLGLS